MKAPDGRRRKTLKDADVRAITVGSAVGRLAIGLGLMVAPRRALGALGFGDAGEGAVVIAQIAGIRDMVLGGTTLLALEDADRLRVASLANAIADGGDAISFALALRRGGTPDASLRGIAAALPASLSSLWVAWRLR